jgi:hypothetical protein
VITRPAIADVHILPDGTAQIDDCQLYENGQIEQSWLFSGYERQMNCWIARSITYTDYEQVDSNHTAPAKVYQFTLSSVTSNCDTGLFGTPESLFPQVTYIESYKGQSLAFSFRPGQGTLAQQMEAAQNNQTLTRNIAQQGNTRATSSIVVIVAATVAALAWLFWRRLNRRAHVA